MRNLVMYIIHDRLGESSFVFGITVYIYVR